MQNAPTYNEFRLSTCVKRPLKIVETKILMSKGSLFMVKSIAECSPRLYVIIHISSYQIFFQKLVQESGKGKVLQKRL